MRLISRNLRQSLVGFSRERQRHIQIAGTLDDAAESANPEEYFTVKSILQSIVTDGREIWFWWTFRTDRWCPKLLPNGAEEMRVDCAE